MRHTLAAALALLSCASEPTNRDPVARLAGPAEITLGGVADFDASGSFDPDGAIASFSFDFGDGTPPTTIAGPFASHTYGNRGTFEVTVTVEDDKGAAGATTHRIFVNTSPVISFDPPPMVLPGTPVTFDASASTDVDGSIVTYTFDYGDGDIVTQPLATTTHTFQRAGTYSVSVIATDDRGASSSAARPVTVGVVFSRPVNVSNTPAFSVQAAVARGPGGIYYVVWLEPGVFPMRMLVSSSVDGGMTFGAAVDAVPPVPFLSFAASQVQALVTSDGTLHLAFTVFDESSGAAEVGYTRSTDSGRTFSYPSIVSLKDGKPSHVPVLATDAAGCVGIAWDDYALYGGDMFARSCDGGATFSDGVRTGTWWSPSIAMGASGEVFIASVTDGQIWYARSVDGGATFLAPGTVPGRGAAGHASVHATQSGDLLLIWEDGVRWPRAMTVLVSRSADWGTTWTEARDLLGVASAISCDSSHSNGVDIYLVCTTDRDTGGPFPPFFLIASSDGGVTFSPPLRIPTPEYAPGFVRAGDAGQIALAWTFDEDVFFATGVVSLP